MHEKESIESLTQALEFVQTHNIGNHANIGIRGFTMWKQKLPATKCYPSEYLTPVPLSKNQVVYQQKVKDLLSSTYQISLERRVLDLELGFQDSILMGVIFCYGNFSFSCSKASDANISIIADFFEKRFFGCWQLSCF